MTHNVLATSELTVAVETVEHTLHAGFRQEWTTAESDGVHADLCVGAGLGSPYMVLTVEREGKTTIHETVDVRTFLPGWIDAAIARADERR